MYNIDIWGFAVSYVEAVPISMSIAVFILSKSEEVD
jgi:hypothetical protein